MLCPYGTPADKAQRDLKLFLIYNLIALPLTFYFCLTKFAQWGEPPQRTDKPHNDNFALPLTFYLRAVK